MRQERAGEADEGAGVGKFGGAVPVSWRTVSMSVLRPRAATVVALLLAASSASHAQQPATAHPMRVNYNVQVRARDGVHLSADIFRPTDDAKHPVVLTITPY